jgi:dihydrofolate reductase
MKLYHIVAMAQNRVIGKEGRLPWHFSTDLKHFKQTTIGSALIMGRKTFESLGKRPLPGRENFVLSRTYVCHSEPRRGEESQAQRSFASLRMTEPVSGVRFFNSLESALKAAPTEQVFIIGGETLFKETMNRIDGIYLTRIDASYEGDVFYPEIPKGFKEQSRKDLQNNPKIEVIFYEKK